MFLEIAFVIISTLLLLTPSINAFVTKYEYRKEVLILNIVFIAACEYIGSVVSVPVLSLELISFIILMIYSSDD